MPLTSSFDSPTKEKRSSLELKAKLSMESCDNTAMVGEDDELTKKSNVETGDNTATVGQDGDKTESLPTETEQIKPVTKPDYSAPVDLESGRTDQVSNETSRENSGESATTDNVDSFKAESKGSDDTSVSMMPHD